MSLTVTIPPSARSLLDTPTAFRRDDQLHSDLKKHRLILQSSFPYYPLDSDQQSGITATPSNTSADVQDTPPQQRHVLPLTGTTSLPSSPAQHNNSGVNAGNVSTPDDSSNHKSSTTNTPTLPITTSLPISREFYLSDLWDSSFAYTPPSEDSQDDDDDNDMFLKNRLRPSRRNGSHSSSDAASSKKGKKSHHSRREEPIMLQQFTGIEPANTSQPYSFFSQIWRRPSAPALFAVSSNNPTLLQQPRRYSLRMQPNDHSQTDTPSSIPSATSHASSEESSVPVAELYRRYYHNPTSYGVDDESLLGGSHHGGQIRFNDDDSMHTASNGGDIRSNHGYVKDSSAPSSPVVGFATPPFSFWKTSSAGKTTPRFPSFGVQGLPSASSITLLGTSSSDNSANTPNVTSSQGTNVDSTHKSGNRAALIKSGARHRHSKSMSAVPNTTVSSNLAHCRRASISGDDESKSSNDCNEDEDEGRPTPTIPVFQSSIVPIPAAFYKTGIFITAPSSITTQKRDRKGATQKGFFTVYTILVRLLRANLPLFNNPSPASFTVYRRYREFRAFYREIVKKYSDRIVGLPPFPKKSFFERLSPSIVQARQSAFATLLSFIALDPVLSNDPLLAQFLGLDFSPFSSLSRNGSNNIGGVVLYEKNRHVRDSNDSRMIVKRSSR
ncbi:hypothetical protein SeMB42_g05548 [Synchytrium endobioticum]|nr:hypothetical protein SeMB42_g05548 [Synchytrium endobioticum]